MRPFVGGIFCNYRGDFCKDVDKVRGCYMTLSPSVNYYITVIVLNNIDKANMYWQNG